MDNLIRAQVCLPQDDKHAATQIALWQNVSFGEIVRRALKEYVQKQHQKQAERAAVIDRLAGALKNSPTWKGIDAVAWQRKLRHEKGI